MSTSLSARGRRTPLAAAAICIALAAGSGGAVAAWASSGSGSTQVPQLVSPSQVETFVSVNPTRIVDTRQGTPNPFTPGESRDISLAGRIDPRATAVVLNVTLAGGAVSSQGFVTIWPTGTSRPNASANNPTPGVDQANLFIAKLGTNQGFSVYNDRGNTHIVLDVVGMMIPLDEVDLSGAGGGGTGPQGPAGPAGAQGPAGPAGATGPAGAAGPAGPAGADGDDGAQGPQGVQGPAGGLVAGFGGSGPTPPLTALGIPAYFGFSSNQVSFGSNITANSGRDTFTVASAGVFRVTLTAEITAALLGGVAQIEVNGVAAGAGLNVAATGTVSRSVLVNVGAGQTIRASVSSLLGLSLGGTGYLTIEQVA